MAAKLLARLMKAQGALEKEWICSCASLSILPIGSVQCCANAMINRREEKGKRLLQELHCGIICWSWALKAFSLQQKATVLNTMDHFKKSSTPFWDPFSSSKVHTAFAFV